MQLNLLHCLLLTDEYQMQKIDFCHVAKNKIVFSIIKNFSKNLEELQYGAPFSQDKFSPFYRNNLSC